MEGLPIPGSLAVVTGASSGIGEATARLLASKGSHVLLLARNPERLDALAHEIRTGGGKADPFAVDLADSRAGSYARPVPGAWVLHMAAFSRETSLPMQVRRNAGNGTRH